MTKNTEQKWAHQNCEKLYYLCWITLNIKYERIHDRWRWCYNDNELFWDTITNGLVYGVEAKLTDGMKCKIRPGRGDFPVGQFDAQNSLPNGNGMPSLANSSSKKSDKSGTVETILLTLIHSRLYKNLVQLRVMNFPVNEHHEVILLSIHSY